MAPIITSSCRYGTGRNVQQKAYSGNTGKTPTCQLRGTQRPSTDRQGVGQNLVLSVLPSPSGRISVRDQFLEYSSSETLSARKCVPLASSSNLI
ncbi:hypothetical protein MPTK1_4g03000 [Marchantia polymorpha subsp. ruderalis]|uniref:Uncharacterized protein n=2 Tax=Marchantia polymorpha TaxID=3197 RepID=A0AAF6B5Q4_MARPO|nr:hypothetical protein MARPO_0323s0001 [Marchantia polymorpha]BBN07338.1 hypothetical protein Mp_4g03000 [Marchantia polymorpha subsp. ruderalis]|eukprot:PTQ26832.1 hypothetical protein MARPO_0323s0001 [Marchantia polymorpha]